MQVPNTPADVAAALPARSGPAAVTAVSAVQPLPEQAKNLDTRLALQAVQPNQQAEAGTATRQSLDTPAVHLRTQSAVLNWLSQSGTSASTPGASVAAWLAMHFSHRQEMSRPWPMPSTPSTALADQNARTAAHRLLAQLQTGLSESGVFAASQLATQFFRPLVRSESPHTFGLQNGLSTVAEAPLDDGAWTAALKHLAPDADAAKLAGQMLVTGQLVWEGELMPGIPLRVTRRDAWESNSEQGEAIKGVALHMNLTLPTLGPIDIHAQLVGEMGSIQITSASELALNRLRSNWADIQSALQNQNFQSTLTVADSGDA